MACEARQPDGRLAKTGLTAEIMVTPVIPRRRCARMRDARYCRRLPSHRQTKRRMVRPGARRPARASCTPVPQDGHSRLQRPTASDEPIVDDRSGSDEPSRSPTRRSSAPTRAASSTSACRAPIVRPARRWPSPTPPVWPRSAARSPTDPTLAARYTWAHRLVAVVSDGTAVLGLGDIGPRAVAAGDGGQGGAVQDVRRAGLDPVGAGHHRRRRDRRDPGPAAPLLRRGEPGGHLRAALLRAGAQADRGAGLPGHARRPARHRDRGARRAARRRTVLGRPTGRAAGGHRRCRRGRGGVREDPARGRCRATSTVLDSRGIIHPRPGRPEPDQGRARREHQPSGLRGGLAEALAGADVFIGLSCSHGAGGRCSPPWPRRPSCSRCPTRTRRSTPTSRAGTPRWWPPGAATSRTRSTTCWPSRGSSGARWTPGATRITENMKLAAAEAIAAVADRRARADHIVPSAVRPPGRPRGGAGRGRRRGQGRRCLSSPGYWQRRSRTGVAWAYSTFRARATRPIVAL